MEAMESYTLYVQKVKGQKVWYASLIHNETGEEEWLKQFEHEPSYLECAKEFIKDKE